MKDQIVKEIKGFYDDIKEDRAGYFETVLLELDNDENHDAFGWEKNTSFRNNLIWCDYESLPIFVAYALHNADIDMYEVMKDLYIEQRDLDREESDYYKEVQEDYRSSQGWE